MNPELPRRVELLHFSSSCRVATERVKTNCFIASSKMKLIENFTITARRRNLFVTKFSLKSNQRKAVWIYDSNNKPGSINGFVIV
jgi:hypothetical protein